MTNWVKSRNAKLARYRRQLQEATSDKERDRIRRRIQSLHPAP